MSSPNLPSVPRIKDRAWWREQAQDLAFFNCHIMPYAWDDKFHDFGKIHYRMCHHLDPRWNKNPQIYLSAHRGSGKTTQLMGFGCWWFTWNHVGKRTDAMIYNTATKENAWNMQGDVKHSLLENEFLQWIFPELPTRETEYDVITKNRVQMRHVRFDFSSLETTLVSRHYPNWMNDDLENDVNAKSEYGREDLKKTWKYQKAILTKIKSRGIGREMEVGTPYHHNALTWMIRNMPRYSKLEIPCYINRDKLQGVEYDELYTVEDFEAKREAMGNSIFCTPAETPILMADWTIRRISEVKVGDEVVGFAIGGSRKGKYVRSIVKSVYKGLGQVLDVEMSSATNLRCTPEHKWFSGRLEDLKEKRSSHHKLYKKIRRNTNLIRLLDVTEEKDPERLRAWSYLGGIIDGEGGCKGPGIFIHQSPEANPEVYAKIKSTLDFLGIKYSEVLRPRIDGHHAVDGHLILVSSMSYFYLKGGRQLYFDLIRYSGLAKKDQLVRKMWKHNGFANKKDKINDIVPEKTRTVYGLETGTGNYIAWGCLSSNSAQYLLLPLSEEDALLPEAWLRYWDDLPDVRWRTMVIDPGGAEPGKSDATGITICDTDENGVMYVVYAEEHFVTPVKMLELIGTLKKEFDPDDIRIEKEKGSTTVADTMQHRFAFLGIAFVQHRGRAKGDRKKQINTRIWRLRQHFEMKRILFGRNMPVMVEQAQTFPQTSTGRDDLCDSLAYHLDIRRIPKRRGKLILPSGREFNPIVEPDFEKELDEAIARNKNTEGAEENDRNW